MKTFSLFVLACTVVLGVEGQGFINCTRPNEEYACGSACQTECATLGQNCPIVTANCNDACYCIDGYARNSSGACIPSEQCRRS